MLGLDISRFRMYSTTPVLRYHGQPKILISWSVRPRVDAFYLLLLLDELTCTYVVSGAKFGEARLDFDPPRLLKRPE